MTDNILIDDPISIFIYLLLKEDMMAGDVEARINQAMKYMEYGVPDSLLAGYSQVLSAKLKEAKVNKMSEKLSQMFGDGNNELDEKEELNSPIFHRDSQKEIEEEMELLKDEINEAAKNVDPELNFKALVDEAEQLSDELLEEEQAQKKITTLTDAEIMVLELKERGIINDEQVSHIQSDIRQFKEAQDGRTSETKE